MEKRLEDNLKRIRQLTDNLVTLPEIAHLNDNCVDYDMNTGKCSGVGLMWVDSVAVQRGILSADSEMISHIHEGVSEILICYEGSLEVLTKDENDNILITSVTAGQLIEIPSMTPHIVKSTNGCKLIAVTMPASQGYPHGKQ
jgi:hypothetical protein